MTADLLYSAYLLMGSRHPRHSRYAVVCWIARRRLAALRHAS